MVRNIAVILLGCLVLICSAIAGGIAVDYFRGGKPYEQIKANNPSASWLGPPPGTVLDLHKFKNRSGDPIPASGSDAVILLALVNSNCRTVLGSRELFSTVSSFATSKGVKTYLISDVPDPAARDADAYDFLGKEVYVWQDLNADSSIRHMVVPSHLLVDGEGRILNTFPGGSANPQTRQEMADQITADLGMLLNTTQANPRE